VTLHVSPPFGSVCGGVCRVMLHDPACEPTVTQLPVNEWCPLCLYMSHSIMLGVLVYVAYVQGLRETGSADAQTVLLAMKVGGEVNKKTHVHMHTYMHIYTVRQMGYSGRHDGS